MSTSQPPTTVSIIRTKSSSSVVLTGNPVHPIRFALASSLFCCSSESLLCCETLKSSVEIFCRDAQALFALHGPSLSSEVFCNCEVGKKKKIKTCFFSLIHSLLSLVLYCWVALYKSAPSSYHLPNIVYSTFVLLSLDISLLLFVLHFCSLLLSNAKDYECSLTLPIEWKEVESCFELIPSWWKTLHYINYTFILHF